MSLPGGWELVLILIVLVLLFGAKKLPDAARSLGRSMRIFKSEVKEMGNDDQPQAPQPQQGQPYPGQPGPLNTQHTQHPQHPNQPGQQNPNQ